jgi:putative FmdB family regulatory protein
MPTYQYRCSDCGQDLEVVQKFADAALTECPTCAGRLRKIYNAVGVVFKGSGFYSTDSRGSAKSSTGSDSNGTASDAKSESSSSSSGPSDKSSADKSSTGSTSSGSNGSSTSAPAKAAAS